jgi:hypothetical protein
LSEAKLIALNGIGGRTALMGFAHSRSKNGVASLAYEPQPILPTKSLSFRVCYRKPVSTFGKL